jgi:hypothetical protein
MLLFLCHLTYVLLSLYAGAFKLDPNRVCELLLEAAERDEAGVGHWLSLMGLFNKKAPMEVRK